jgi:hypothetical protein
MRDPLVIDILITASNIEDNAAVHDLGGGQLLMHYTYSVG